MNLQVTDSNYRYKVRIKEALGLAFELLSSNDESQGHKLLPFLLAMLSVVVEMVETITL